jgi:hypothetical protein
MKDEEKMTFRPFYISFDWVLTSPNWHWKQQKYPFLMVLATHSRLESFWCSFFSFIFISFTCHATHCDFYLFFWKIIKDFETLSIDMKKHANFLLMQIIFIL